MTQQTDPSAENSQLSPGKRHYPSRRSHRAASGTQTDLPPVTGPTSRPELPSSPSSDLAESETLAGYWPESQAAELFPAAQRGKQSARAKRGRRRRKRRTIAMVIILAVLLVLGVGVYVSVQALGGPAAIFSSGDDYEGEGSGTVYVDIPSGASGHKIGQILEAQGVIKSADTFASVFKKNSLAQGVQSGRFEMHKHMSAKAALSRLLDPQARADRNVTIPEGFTVKQIKERLIKTNGFPAAEVEQAFANPAQYGIKATGEHAFEGWLAASSYVIKKETKVSDLVKQMVDLQVERLDQAQVPVAQRQEALIKASILEREVNQARYYGKVARIIDNRLNNKSETMGRLQMDSTVLYGVGKTGGIPTKAELKQDTPYNTYLHQGLPPTPIGTPGEKSMAAIMHPEAGNWLYFVTVNLDNGETKFASTLAEHNANVEQFKQWCAQPANKAKC